MNNNWITIPLFLLISLSLYASGNRELNSVLQITDSTGNIIELESIPERITFVGKASNIVGDVLYMFPEAASRIVGVGNTNQRNGDFIEILDPAYSEKIYLEHSVGPEQIAVTRPDLVVMKNFHKGKLGAAVQQMGVPVLYLDLESPEAYESDFRILGQVFDNESRAEELISFYKTERTIVENRTASLSVKPSVLFLYHSTRDGVSAFNIPPESWIQTRMVKMAGGNPIWINANPGSGWSKINLEQIAAWNPDQIYIVAYKEDIHTVLKTIEDSVEWSELKALKNKKLKAFPVDFYSWDQPDSRWILGLKWLATQIHGQLFSDFDIESNTKTFFKDLYFLTDEQYENEILTRLGW